jgi:hypothetical protein
MLSKPQTAKWSASLLAPKRPIFGSWTHDRRAAEAASRSKPLRANGAVLQAEAEIETGHKAEAEGHENRRGDEMIPLNGTKTHPLSAHAIDELRNIARSPEPIVGINPGVINRLMRENLVEIVQLPSPFKTHKGRPVGHLRITNAGRERLATL